MKADRKDPKPEIVTPADNLCNLCDGNDRGLYVKVFRESEEVEAEISEEAKQNKGLPCGVKPNAKEVDDHNRTHLPFRSCCKHCVLGKGITPTLSERKGRDRNTMYILGLHVYERRWIQV